MRIRIVNTVLASASTLFLIFALPFYVFGYQLFGFRFTGENLLLLGVVSLINVMSSAVVGLSGNRRFLMAVPLGLASLTLATGFSIFADVDAVAFSANPHIPWWGGVGCRLAGICLPKWLTGVFVGVFLDFYWFAAAYLFLFRTPVGKVLIVALWFLFVIAMEKHNYDVAYAEWVAAGCPGGSFGAWGE